MSSDEQILEVLAAKEISLRGVLVKDISKENLFFANIAITKDNHGRRVPSYRTLEEVRQILKKQNIEIEYLLSDDSSAELEGGLRATLITAFPDDIRNVFSSDQNKTANVWIEAKRPIPGSTNKEISKHVQKYFDLSRLTVSSIAFLAEENVPGKIAILTAIRQLAPIQDHLLIAHLMNKGFVIPSTDWLARRLDALRKSNNVVRLHDGRYCLSVLSIRNLGTRKSRESPDVKRLLALANPKL